MKEATIIVTVFSIAMLGIFLWSDMQHPGNTDKKKNKELVASSQHNASSDVKIVDSWNLPPVLTEISGLSHLNDKQFATVQDEMGTIFIYDIGTKKIEKEIIFAGPGDYEGIAVANEMIYVVRADGMLYQVSNLSGKPAIQEYKTPLTVNDNVEGLCYDRKNNRLLLAAKDGETTADGKKPVYAFDLASKKLLAQPAYTIDVAAIGSNKEGKKKKSGSFSPSAISIDPATSAVYITDGPGSRLVILSQDGQKQTVYSLGKNDFPQPEGISFDDQGQLFISNEGKKQSGTILKVQLGQ